MLGNYVVINYLVTDQTLTTYKRIKIELHVFS